MSDDFAIFPKIEPLEHVQGHSSVAGITRFVFDGLPFSLAVHRIEDISTSSNYCTRHEHDDFLELNIILPDETGLSYAVEHGDQKAIISEICALWMETEEPHSANAQSGSGWFICLRLPKAET